jgi:glycosyltransferase involved in cell wall biosynthesis
MLLLLCLAMALAMLAVVTWNVVAWPAVGAAGLSRPARVSVLIPARNEAATIAACLASVVAQGPPVEEVLVYDDESADDTAALVRSAAVGDARIHLLTGGTLPPGWFGKPHACMQLATAAGGEWLLFLDADARLLPGALARLVEEARRRGVTLLSPWPGLQLVSVWEQLLMPVLNLVVFTLYPGPLSLVRRDPALGLAHGACILVRRETYVRLGGHALVRDELFEDSWLARRWRARGEPALCLDGRTIVQVRMYRTLAEIWSGFQKNLYPAFAWEASFWALLLLHAAVFVVPAVMLVTAPSLVAAAALAAGIAMRILLAVRFRQPLWSVWFQPAAACSLIGLGLVSRWRYRRAGVEWKGRRYTRAGAVV